MAFERIGLGGILRFDEKPALAGMRRAQAGFARLQGGVRKLGAGLSMMGDGMRNAGMALLPVTAGLGFGVKKAADFEKQMSAVGAITRSSADELATLSNEAKRQGVVSVFSAQQSAEAMEFMGRAGFDTTQIVKGLGGVMAAAAADGISLATSSDIVARVVKGMGLEIEQANHVADVLALTSAKTNTNITALGEAFTYGAPQAKALGVSLEETTAAFGLMADAGLRGSIGGTSFMNMLVKLSKPSTKAQALIKKFGITLTDTQGRLKPLPDIIGLFKTELDKVNDVTKRAAMMAEIFGLRGAKAYSALSLAGRQKMAELTEDLEASSFGLGAAQEMANKRLDNFLGALTLFGSSLEAVAIEFFGPFLNVFKETTQDMTAALNGVLFAVQALKQIREQASISAVKAAKRETAVIVEQQQALAGLERREQSTAKAGIAAIQSRLIGQEKLTREQQRARSRSFAEFVKGNLAREKLSKQQRKRELKAIEAFIEGNEKGTLSGKERIAMERRYLQTLVTVGAKGKKIGQAEAARRAANLENLIKQRAEAAKFEAAAEAVILKQEKLAEVEQEHGRTARLIAEGVLAAIDQIKAGFKTAIQAVQDFGNRFGEAIGEGRLKNFARIATIGVVVAGALAPVFLGFAGVGFILKSVVLPQLLGLFKIVGALKPIFFGVLGVVKGLLAVGFWPLVVVGGLIAGAFLLLRKQGESITDTFYRLGNQVKTMVTSLFGFRQEGETMFAALQRGFGELVQGAERFWLEGIKPFLVDAWTTVMSVINTAVVPFLTGFFEGVASTWRAVWDTAVGVFNVAWSVIQEVIGVFSTVWTEVIDLFVDDIDRTEGKWLGLGQSIATVASWILDTVLFIVKGALNYIKLVLKGIKVFATVALPTLLLPFKGLWEGVKGVASGIMDLFRGSFKQGLRKIFVSLVDIVLLPFRMILKTIVQLTKVAPGLMGKLVSPETAAKLDAFAKYGFAGPPKAAKQTAQVIDLATERRKRAAAPGRLEMPALNFKGTRASSQIGEILKATGKEANQENVLAARRALQTVAQRRRKETRDRERAADKQLQANVKVEDKRTLDIKNKMCVDGEAASVATSRHKQSIFERNGATHEPYLRKLATETGTRVAGNSRG